MDNKLRGRLMVGQRPLKPFINVRIVSPQPMKTLSETEKKEAGIFFDEAAKVAEGSLCLRAKCGSVIVRGGEIIGKGYNSPPQDNPEFRTCLQEYDIPVGFRHDRTCCIHAEQRAIEDAIRHGQDMIGAIIYFTSINGEKKRQPSNRLCCTICSRAVLNTGIAEFILEWEDGTIHSYSTDEFDRLSYEYKTSLK